VIHTTRLAAVVRLIPDRRRRTIASNSLEVVVFRRFLRSLLVASSLPVAVVAMTPMAAHADTAMVTITVGETGKLLDPTLVRVPVTITCAPLVVATDQGGANLKQAVPQGIAFGSGFEEHTITCDGTSHPNSYLIWVNTASPGGFQPGSATVQVSAFLCSATFTCQSGASAIQVIRLRR
jgi:hypothetical protein